MLYKSITNEMDTKEKLATIALLSAIGFGIAGTAIPPYGIIDKSLLYMIAQLLVFAATLLGFGQTIERITNIANDIKKKKEVRNESKQ